jgi:hypothetical protein
LIWLYFTYHFPSVVLYGYETWSVTLREEHRLRVFENRVLRRIFGPKREEVVGDWGRLHNEELHNCTLHRILLSDQIKDYRRGACRTDGRDEQCIKNLVGIREGTRPLGGFRQRWEDNIKMGLTEIVWEGVDWMQLAQDRDHWRAVVNRVMNLRIP